MEGMKKNPPIDPMPMGVATERSRIKGVNPLFTHGFINANQMPIKSPHWPQLDWSVGAKNRERRTYPANVCPTRCTLYHKEKDYCNSWMKSMWG